MFELILTTLQLGRKFSLTLFKFSNPNPTLFGFFYNPTTSHLLSTHPTVFRLHQKQALRRNQELIDSQCEKVVENYPKVYLNSFCQFNHSLTSFHKLLSYYARRKTFRLHFFG